MKQQIDEVIARLGGRRQVGILGVGVACVLLVLSLSWWATRPDWVPAASGLPLDAVTDLGKRLDDAKIRYRLDSTGQGLLVSAEDLARARVALAQGGLPGTGRPGMELFDQPSWGMTDFTQRINYRRALEGELERTIRRMRGVEEAQVHLAIEESQSFRRAQVSAEASVVLRLRSGQRPDAEVVQGIQHLVASSVGGLQSGNVMVLDDAGRLLSIPNEPGSMTALTYRQLGMRRELEAHLERKAEAIVAQVVGGQNARVEVSAEINFDRIERTTESIDVEGQVIATEQSSEIVPGAQGGAGSRTTSTTYDNPRLLETFSGAVGGLSRLTVAVLVNEIEQADGSRRPHTDAELEKIRTLVQSAVGYQAARGDMVSVIGMSFAPVAPIVSAPGGWEMAPQEMVRPGIWLLGLLAVFVVALKLIRALRVTAAPVPAASMQNTIAAAPGMGALHPTGHETAAALPPPGPSLPTPRDRVVDLIDERPDVAARLVRSWLKEAAT